MAITSFSVRQPMPNLILSNTARAGATAFLKTLAREVAGDGVTVNSRPARPPRHRPDRQLYGGDPRCPARGIPAGFMGDAADFGQVVAFLCSEHARFVTGVHLPVDGGATPGCSLDVRRRVRVRPQMAMSMIGTASSPPTKPAR